MEGVTIMITDLIRRHKSSCSTIERIESKDEIFPRKIAVQTKTPKKPRRKVFEKKKLVAYTFKR